MCGDESGFSMLMGVFSVVQMKLPIKSSSLTNSVLGFVAMEMKAGSYLTDNLPNCTAPISRGSPKYAALPVFAWKSRRRGRATLYSARFPRDGPVLVDVVVAKKELAIPPPNQNWNKRKEKQPVHATRHY